jgi:hypothetical protein
VSESRVNDWCRCEALVPRNRDWSCPLCDKRRRYHERLSVGNSAVIGTCGECRTRTITVRFVTCNTALAGDHRQSHTYLMCDPCIDKEIVRQRDADIEDHRPNRAPVPSTCSHCGRETNGRAHWPQNGYCVLAPTTPAPPTRSPEP